MSKIWTSVFFIRLRWNLLYGVTLGKEQHKMFLKGLRLFFDQPDWPTKVDQYWINSTLVFFIWFWWNLLWGTTLGKYQHRMYLKGLRLFERSMAIFWTTQLTHQSQPIVNLHESPALLMLQPHFCFAPALLLPCWSCPPQFGNLHHHHQHFTTFFGTARAAFYGTMYMRVWV